MSRLLFSLSFALLLLSSCVTKQYEECDADRIFTDWGITDNTHAFGEYDSIYYLVNPIGLVSDSIYYNGNYTDSYFHSDSTRVMLRYTLADSINFHIDRMYAVETNPRYLIVKAEEENDSSKTVCQLKLIKDSNSDNIYRCGPDSTFKEMLKREGLIRFKATNGESSSSPQGSQNYEFFLFARGFNKAILLADSLNRKFTGKSPADTTKNRKHSNILKNL